MTDDLVGRDRGDLRGARHPRSEVRKELSGIRVHLIINHFGLDRGGAERLVRHLRRDLEEAGVDVRMVALEACPTEGAGSAVSLGGRGAYDPRVFPRLAAYARTEVRSGDVVHAHLFPASAHVAALVRLGFIRAPCIFTEHSTRNRRRHHPLGTRLDRSVYGAFHRIVAISEGVQKALLEAYPALRGKTDVIWNGCELFFDSPPERARDPATPTILSIGRLTEAKNHEAALKALAGLTDRDFRYVLLGDGEKRGRLTALAAELGLCGRVVFAGHRSDIRPYLLDADIFLLPSLWEGFGLAAVEAMNAGLPVVASDVVGLKEVVGETGGCGILVDPNSVPSIRSALRVMLDAPSRRLEMGGRGFERALRFDRAGMTRSYIDVYGKLAEAASKTTQTYCSTVKLK